jgi:hypothetical protein
VGWIPYVSRMLLQVPGPAAGVPAGLHPTHSSAQADPHPVAKCDAEQLDRSNISAPTDSPTIIASAAPEGTGPARARALGSIFDCPYIRTSFYTHDFRSQRIGTGTHTP